MSLNPVPIESVRTIDPRIDLLQPRFYEIVKCAREVTYQQFTSQSFSNSQIQITANPPSANVIVSRKMYVEVTFSLSFNGTITAPNTVLLVSGADAPRAWPLNMCMQTLQVSIGNDTISMNVNQYWDALLRYHNDPYKTTSLEFSTTPSTLDQYQQYADYLDNQRGGSSKNVLGGYGETGISDLMGNRGGFSYTVTNNNLAGGNPAVVTLTVTEPIIISPLEFGCSESSGLTGIQNLNVTLVLGNLRRLWSHAIYPAPGVNNTINSMSISVVNARLLCAYMTPEVTQSVPQMLSWSYYEIVNYPTSSNTPVANGNSITLQSTNIQLKSIPCKFYIYAKMRDQDIDSTPLVFSPTSTFPAITHTDTYASITNLVITFNNRVGLLSSASQQDLYQVSVKNGLKMSYMQFTQFCGSVVCITPLDIGLDMLESAGLIGNYQFQIQATVTNPSLLAGNPTANPITYTLQVVAVYEGVYNMINGSFSRMTGVFSQEDVLKHMEDMPIKHESRPDVYGGNFWGPLLGAIKLALGKARGFIPTIRKGLDIGDKILGDLGIEASGRRRRRKSRSRSRSRRRGSGLLEYGATGEGMQGYGRRRRKSRSRSRSTSRRRGRGLIGGARANKDTLLEDIYDRLRREER